MSPTPCARPPSAAWRSAAGRPPPLPPPPSPVRGRGGADAIIPLPRRGRGGGQPLCTGWVTSPVHPHAPWLAGVWGEASPQVPPWGRRGERTALDFYPRAPYSPNVIYGQFRTLINLLLVLALGAVFLWGGFRAFGAFTSSASAPLPTATPRPVVQQLPTIPPATPTRRAGTGTGAKATATPRPTPRPSPTPNTPPKVIVALSVSDTKGATSLSAASVPIRDGYPSVYCLARNTALPAQGSVTFTWYNDQPNAFLWQQAIPRQPGDFTIYYYEHPQFKTPGGKFHCNVAVNGVDIGSAHFTITP